MTDRTPYAYRCYTTVAVYSLTNSPPAIFTVANPVTPRISLTSLPLPDPDLPTLLFFFFLMLAHTLLHLRPACMGCVFPNSKCPFSSSYLSNVDVHHQQQEKPQKIHSERYTGEGKHPKTEAHARLELKGHLEFGNTHPIHAGRRCNSV